MTRAFQIRPAVSTDAEAIARLTGELGYPASPEDIRARLERLLRADTDHVAVAAQDGGAVLGWLAASARLSLESGERAEIVGLVVTAGARRLGIGTALVGAAEAWAVARGLPAILVRSNVARSESHAFYQGLGYACRKTQHVYVRSLPCLHTPSQPEQSP